MNGNCKLELWAAVLQAIKLAEHDPTSGEIASAIRRGRGAALHILHRMEREGFVTSENAGRTLIWRATGRELNVEPAVTPTIRGEPRRGLDHRPLMEALGMNVRPPDTIVPSRVYRMAT